MSRNTPHIPLVLAALLAPACVEEVTVPEPEPLVEAELGDERQIQLRFLRLDAKDFVQELSLEDIKERFPEKILRETWLLDMDLEPLIRNALLTLIATPELDVPQLPRSAQNMWKLLNMTAKSTSLDGTTLAPLIGVGEAVGLGPATILADLIAVDPNEPIITVDLTTRAVIDNVVTTHPNAQFRPGPVDAEHPDGKYPVAPGSLPVSLWDVVTDFAEMPLRFGPADSGEPAHPGFIGGEFKFKATTPDFKMVVKVDLNALPYKGLDLTDGTVANVNSTKSQILSAFDFTSDDWMAIEGLVPALVVEEMTMTIAEDPAFVASGASQTPAPLGDSPVWDLPRWLFERLIAEVAVARAAAIPAHCSEYGPKGQVDPPFIAVQACIGQGAYDGDAFDPEAEAPEHWTSIAVDDSVVLDSPPPPPSYFWDVLLEVAQVRLHDGGLKEGEGDISFTLKDVPVGTTVDQLVSQIKGNIQKNPAALSAIAELLNENTEGRADFYYYVPKLDNDPELQGDWLYFVTAADIENDDDGAPVRPYGYKKPGFFRDSGLKDKASAVIAIDGDTSHEKVKIAEGDVLYLLDDEQRLFKLVVDAKPAPHSVALTVTRAR
ncbi:acetyltransferase [Nannocystis sp. SCPEA4]|uniref:acetyltransferase n=1 Tax=Nannocystis sp. SCPEA4 TaxID=2996787 RepID=UPI002271591C|nr:acetyltransferase [Nannocystis sp. SCPEA4]MCY1062924.1 acetyltransferase [Nannocystis sp. SCPEA4]